MKYSDVFFFRFRKISFLVKILTIEKVGHTCRTANRTANRTATLEQFLRLYHHFECMVRDIVNEKVVKRWSQNSK